MSHERWGTFSVADHLREAPFVTDVILYDRLIIPVPPDDAEYARWTENNWEPERLDAYLDVLGETAIRVRWDNWKGQQFKTRFDAAKAADFDARGMATAQANGLDPMHLSRVMLTQEFVPALPHGVSKAWAMAAYPSESEFMREFGPGDPQARRSRLGMMLSHRLLVPAAGQHEPHIDLLKRAVDLATTPDFKRKRAEFHAWQEQVIENLVSDDKAIEEMEKCLDEYNAVVQRAMASVYLKFAFTIIPIGLSIAGAALINPLVLTGAAVSLIRFATFDRKPNIQAGDCAAAAMFYDAREHLGW